MTPSDWRDPTRGAARQGGLLAAGAPPSRMAAGIAILVALVTFFIQIGGYTTVSMSFASFVLAAALLGAREVSRGAVMAAFCIPLVYANLYPFLGEPELPGVVLRTTRELAVLAVVFTAATFQGWPRVDRSRFDVYLVMTLAVLCLYAGIQFFWLEVLRTPRFFLDWRLYGNIGGELGEQGFQLTTLPGYWAEFAAKTGLQLGTNLRIRPSAFYSEPSYLGLIVCALVFAMTHRRAWQRQFGLPIGLAILTVLFAQSASGALCLIAYLSLQFRQQLVQHAHLVVVLFVPVGLYALADVLGRVVSIGDANAEFSGFIRLIKPFENIKDVLSNGFVFGVPPAFVNRYISPTEFGPEMGVGLDTGILNLIIFFGVGGLALVLLAWRLMTPLEFLFFVIVGVNNGSLFGFDKAFILGMAIAYGRCHASEPTGDPPRVPDASRMGAFVDVTRSPWRRGRSW